MFVHINNEYIMMIKLQNLTDLKIKETLMIMLKVCELYSKEHDIRLLHSTRIKLNLGSS